MHLGAVLALVAMTAALFGAFPSAQAATGDVSATTGFCVQGPGPDGTFASDDNPANGDETADNELVVRATPAVDGTAVTIEVPDRGDINGDGDQDDTALGEDTDTDADQVNVTCNAAFAGLPVSVAPDVSGTAVVTPKSAALSVSVNDSDNIVAAGGPDLTVTLRFSNIVQFSHDATANANDVVTDDVAVASAAMPATATDASADGVAGQLELLWIRVSGELENPDDPATGAWADSVKTTTLAIPAGTAAGEYTISAAVRYDPNTNSAVTDDDGDGDSTDEDGTVLTGSVVITVGDVGQNAASAELSLSTATYDTASTVKVETVPEDGTEAAAGGDVWLKVVTSNSLGENANSSGLTGLTIIASGGKLAIHANNPLNGQPMTAPVPSGTGSNSAQITANVGNTMHILVSKADRKPGTVDIYAQLVGTDGAPRSNTLSLIFTGASSSVALGESKPVAPGGLTEFTVDAADSEGNPGSIGQLTFKVTDADGKGVSTGKVKITKDTAGSSTPDKDTDDNPLQTVGLVETFSTTAPGVYTVEVALAGVADSAATTTVAVSGLPASLTMEIDNAFPGNDDSFVIATVQVVDENGNPVADDTPVNFAASGDGLILSNTDSDGETVTKGGEASAAFVVVGPGRSVISAVSGGGRAAMAVMSTAGVTAPVDTDAPSAAGLSLSTDAETHDAGAVTVTAMVTDADGNAVEDGMRVQFFALGDAVAFGPSVATTVGGQASAVYVAADDFSVRAISGGAADAITISVTSEAEAEAAAEAERQRIAAEEAAAEAERQAAADAEAAAEAERMAEEAAAEAARIAATVTAETERLSGVSGFTSWLAEGSTTASALFAALSGDGATALHVWNGTAWVRYSVVDGQRVPGSVDFDIERGDVLFISN